MMRLGIAVLACLASSAVAQVSSEGHFYETSCNSSGYALTSKYPVGRFFGQGAGTTISDDRELIYFGRSCDAVREGWNNGKWCWANGGFRVEFDNRIVGFPRQELYCPQGQDQHEITNCQC